MPITLFASAWTNPPRFTGNGPCRKLTEAQPTVAPQEARPSLKRRKLQHPDASTRLVHAANLESHPRAQGSPSSIDGSQDRRPTVAGNESAIEQPYGNITSVYEIHTLQKIELQNVYVPTRVLDRSTQSVKPLRGGPDSGGGGPFKVSANHKSDLPDNNVAATGVKALGSISQTRSQVISRQPSTAPPALVVKQSPKQTISAAIRRPASQDRSTSSLSSLNSDDLIAPELVENQPQQNSKNLPWRVMIKAVLAEAPKSGLTIYEITEKVKELFPHYSRGHATQKLANIEPICSQNFHKHPPDPVAKGKRCRWSLYPHIEPNAPNAESRLPKKSRSQRPSPDMPNNYPLADAEPPFSGRKTGVSGQGAAGVQLPLEASASASAIDDSPDSDRPLIASKRRVQSIVKQNAPESSTTGRPSQNASGLEAWWDSQASTSHRRMKGLSPDETGFLDDIEPSAREVFDDAVSNDSGPRFSSWQGPVMANPQWGKLTLPKPNAPYLQSQKKKHFGKKASLRTPELIGQPIQEVKDALDLPDNAALVVFHGRLAYRDLTKVGGLLHV